MDDIGINYHPKLLEIINNSYSHPNAYDVYLECKKEIPNISLGTVYRNLNTLLETNSIQKIKSTDNIDRYDKIDDFHAHFSILYNCYCLMKHLCCLIPLY